MICWERVKPSEEAFDLYNDYAFIVGFNVRTDKKRYKADKSLSMEIFLCSKSGENDRKV